MYKPKPRKIANEAVIQTPPPPKKNKQKQKKKNPGRETVREIEEIRIFVFLIGDVGFSLMKKIVLDVWACGFL